MPAGKRLVSVTVNRIEGDTVTLTVTNNHTAHAAVVVRATSFGDGQRMRSTPIVVKLAAGASEQVRTSADSLSLAERAAVAGGTVSFNAAAKFADGRLDAHDTGDIFYARDVQGRVTFALRPNVTATHLRGRYATLLAKDPSRALNVALWSAPDAPDGESAVDLKTLEAARRAANAVPSNVGTAATVTRTLCFKIRTTHLDGGVGYLWTSTAATDRAAIGNDIEVGSVQKTLSATVGSSLGCVTGTFTTGLQGVVIRSTGNVNGHTIDVLPSGGTAASYAVVLTIDSSSPNPLLFTALPDASADEDFNIYQAAAMALQSHGGLGSAALVVRPDAGGSSSFTGGEVLIATDDHQEKFTIAHEVGHFILADSVDEPSADYSYNSVSCPSAPDASGNPTHNLGSKERQSAAFIEGYGSFFAADAFNQHTASDCGMIMQEGVAFDCADSDDPGPPDLPFRVMEQNCAATYPGNGNEVDWTRALWNTHTDGATDPTMNDILNWIKSANDSTAWTATNVYALLDARADVILGNLNTAWDGTKGTHGIDHP